jgi:hypothetical protein
MPSAVRAIRTPRRSVRGVEAGATATCSYNSAPPQKTRRLNLSAIFSKTGKGVQEASGKTSHLSRADRAVLSAIDGKTALSEVQKNFEKMAGPKFEALIQQLDKDGFIREVSSGQSAAPTTRPSAPAAKAPPKAAPPSDDGDDMDFTQAIKIPPRAPAPSAPKPPPVDLAATARAESERKQKEEQALDFRSREQAEAKAKAEADQKARAAAEARAKAEAESRARAEAEAKAKAEAEARARADADARTRAEADAKVKAAREAAVRMATEAKAKAEADAKAKAEAAERDKARLEAELNAKLDAERKAREEAEKRAAEAAEVARKELEEKAKRDAEEMRQRLEAEMKAKLDAERKAREEEDRKRREEEDRRRKEEDDRRAREDAERRAREEADRKKREEDDRKRREEDERRRKEEDERRAKEEAERKAREEAERKAREEADRKKREEEDRKRREDDERRALEDTNRRLETERRAKEDAERRAREEAERKAKDEAERRAKDDAERRAKEEAAAKARAAADAAASLPKVDVVAPPPPPPAAGSAFGDSLLADLDSFGKREEEEQKAKEEAERKAKEEAARKAKDDAERRAKEEAARKSKEEADRKAKEEEERRAKEEEERKAQEEEERRKEEEAERKRKAKEAQAAKQAEERAAKAAATKGAAARSGARTDDDDIEVSEDDLDKDDLKRDQKVAADKARKAAREAPPLAVATGGRPKKWGKPAAIALFVLLLGGVAALNLMPLSTAEYEKAASDAMGVPVKISSARLSALAGIEVRLEGVTVGGAKISKVRGTPEIGSLFGARKAFSKVELEGLSVSQAQLGDALLGKVSGENLRVARIVVKQLTLEGPLKLPALDVDATVAGDGTLQAVRLTGADKLTATLSPRGSDIAFEVSAGSFVLPFLPALSLSEFAMKGTANRAGIVSSEFDGRAYDGVISGTSRIRWGDSWTVEGELRARTLKVAVFAPTLVSEGRVEGKATYSMSGSTPATLYESARMQGDFKIEKGVLGSFDLQRALQTSGNQSAGRTIFNELTAQGMYDKGTVQFTNVAISAGAMNAGASLTIDPSGNLSGRIVADVKTASQRQSATLNISGKLQEPVIRK